MDVLRARAYLDLLLDKDSRPRAGDGPAQEDVGAGGFAVRGTLTVPLADLTGLADRPGEMGGIGPVDPWLARDLATAAARNPRTTLVRDGDRRAGARGGARLRPARAQEPRPDAGQRETGETRDRGRAPRGGPAPGFTFTPPGAGGAAGRVRDLAAAHPRRRPGPDRGARLPHHRGLRPPVPGPGPQPRGQAAAPGPDPARHLRQPGLPPARQPVRLRAQHPVRGRRPDLPVQRRPEMPARPPAQAAPPVEGRPAPRRDLPLDHSLRADYITEPTRYPI